MPHKPRFTIMWTEGFLHPVIFAGDFCTGTFLGIQINFVDDNQFFRRFIDRKFKANGKTI